MAIVKKFRITTFKKEKQKVSLKNISLSFNKRQILEDVSFSIREGEICGLLGPNGVGKSTLFNIIIGQLIPDFGKVLIDQKNVTNMLQFIVMQSITELFLRCQFGHFLSFHMVKYFEHNQNSTYKIKDKSNI